MLAALPRSPIVRSGITAATKTTKASTSIFSNASPLSFSQSITSRIAPAAVPAARHISTSARNSFHSSTPLVTTPTNMVSPHSIPTTQGSSID